MGNKDRNSLLAKYLNKIILCWYLTFPLLYIAWVLMQLIFLVAHRERAASVFMIQSINPRMESINQPTNVPLNYWRNSSSFVYEYSIIMRELKKQHTHTSLLPEFQLIALLINVRFEGSAIEATHNLVSSAIANTLAIKSSRTVCLNLGWNEIKLGIKWKIEKEK